jgi:hypothetical protein
VYSTWNSRRIRSRLCSTYASSRPTEFCTTIAPANRSPLCAKARGSWLRYGSVVSSVTKLSSPTNESCAVPRQENSE